MNLEEFKPNDRLRRARSLKGWSQTELAEKIGTSFEMVSRWERGVTVPSPYNRRRLCAVLGQTSEELGLVRDARNSFTPPSSPFVLLASSHIDAEKAIVSELKVTLEERGIALVGSRQLGRRGTENLRTILHEVVQAAQVIVIIVSSEANSSRHVRDALEMARIYQRPVCGLWIEGEHLENCLPESFIELTALIDAREKDTPTVLQETAVALEQILFASSDSTEAVGLSLPNTEMEVVTLTNHPIEMQASMNTSEGRAELVPLQSKQIELAPLSQHSLDPTNGSRPLPADLPHSTTPNIYTHRGSSSRVRASLLIGLAILVIGGGVLGSLSLLTHFGLFGARSGPPVIKPVPGGTWTYGLGIDADSLIPNGGTSTPADSEMDQALYLPLFYGDAHGVIHPGAATEIPTVQNGGVNADATTWTFRLRPHLVWSDGQSYDARDVDYTWRLWANPKFPAGSALGLNLISSAEVSADHLAITFHLKQPFAPFLADLWVDGQFAPLPAHHFSNMTPAAIVKSADNLNPKVTSGPFMMAESLPGDHYTMVRNPRYYLASQGLPYLNKVVFSLAVQNYEVGLKLLQVGAVDSTPLFGDPRNFQAYKGLKDYTLLSPPAYNFFEALYFNFHNQILANHLEVRQAMAEAVDQQALITGPFHGLGMPLCTDHSSAYHPGYDPNAPCPVFELAAANKLLDDNGWVKGSDGVRTKGDQRLEFEYSSAVAITPWRTDVETIIQRDFGQIGIKLDIQNYPPDQIFGHLLPQGKASPPTGAVAGRYDIAEMAQNWGYDPDDSGLFGCNHMPPNGYNITFYCNTALDKLFAQEQATADPGLRQQIFVEIHQIYLTDFPFIVLFGPQDFALAHKGTHNYLPGPTTTSYNIAEWWCDNGKC